MALFDPETVVKSGGLALIAFMVFAESGLLFGIVFPGDTLLFAAGFIAAQGQFGIQTLITVIVISSILGGQAGYHIGQRYGPKVLRKKDGIFFRHEYIEKSEKFYKKHGGKTIMFARFVPVVRTFAPVVAGVGKMDIRKFIIFNIIGSAVWGISVTLAGYYLGSKIPGLADKIELVFLLAIPFIFGPPLYHLSRDPIARKQILSKLKRL